MNLTTRYMGFELVNPFVIGAGPLVKDTKLAQRLEASGASALVMHSLFEEQLTREQLAMHHHTTLHEDSFAEAVSYFPDPEDYHLGPDEYLEQIAKLKEATSVPIIASLNGVTKGGWTEYARLLQQAGADGLELNVYYLPIDLEETPQEVEDRYFDILKAVKGEITIPVAMKLSPFFTAPLNTMMRLDKAGADALVLFNRFYQPDIDIEELEVISALELSNSQDIRLRLRWLAACFGKVQASLAITGGVHTAVDAIKAVMAGADVCQMTSAILRHGPEYVQTIKEDMIKWMTEHEYESIDQMRGSMSLLRCPDPGAFERANYMKVLQSWDLGTQSY